MTAATFRARLAYLFWTQRGFAKLLGVADNTVHRWATSQTRVPDDIAKWLDDFAAHMKANPPPR